MSGCRVTRRRRDRGWRRRAWRRPVRPLAPVAHLLGRDISVEDHRQVTCVESERVAILGRNPEQFADHHDRKREGHVVDDIETADVTKRRQQLLGQLGVTGRSRSTERGVKALLMWPRRRVWSGASMNRSTFESTAPATSGRPRPASYSSNPAAFRASSLHLGLRRLRDGSPLADRPEFGTAVPRSGGRGGRADCRPCRSRVGPHGTVLCGDHPVSCGDTR